MGLISSTLVHKTNSTCRTCFVDLGRIFWCIIYIHYNTHFLYMQIVSQLKATLLAVYKEGVTDRPLYPSLSFLPHLLSEPLTVYFSSQYSPHSPCLPLGSVLRPLPPLCGSSECLTSRSTVKLKEFPLATGFRACEFH